MTLPEIKIKNSSSLVIRNKQTKILGKSRCNCTEHITLPYTAVIMTICDIFFISARNKDCVVSLIRLTEFCSQYASNSIIDRIKNELLLHDKANDLGLYIYQKL